MGKKKIRPIVKTAAYGGMGTGLITMLLMGTSILPFLEYAVPAICAMMIFFIMEECGMQTAVLCYAASSILSVLLVPNKEPAILFALFFGIYPVVQRLLTRHCSKPVQIVLKYLMFNLTMIGAYAVLIYLFGMHELWDELGLGLSYGAAVLLLFGNFAFALFDLLLKKAGELMQAKRMGIPIVLNGYLMRSLRNMRKK